jgi:GTP1/Obg family GTP-binding protein
MFDLSKETALPQEEQLNLFNDIIEKFPETPFIKVLNKVDLLSPTEIEEAQTSLNQDFNISTLTKEGIPNFTIKLKEALNQVIKTNEKFKSLLQLEIAEEYIHKSDEKMDYDI